MAGRRTTRGRRAALAAMRDVIAETLHVDPDAFDLVPISSVATDEFTRHGRPPAPSRFSSAHDPSEEHGTDAM